MSNEAEPMPRLWTSDMTGQIYPVGVIPESSVYSQKQCRTEAKLFLIFKKRGFRAGYWDEKIISMRGLLFYDRGVPLTDVKQNPKAW
ncbi:MAG: hypothetical protein NTY50_12980 [Methylobacter sp.]|nr:hypothetical protein [Methylobacter sp.]